YGLVSCASRLATSVPSSEHRCAYERTRCAEFLAGESGRTGLPALVELLVRDAREVGAALQQAIEPPFALGSAHHRAHDPSGIERARWQDERALVVGGFGQEHAGHRRIFGERARHRAHDDRLRLRREKPQRHGKLALALRDASDVAEALALAVANDHELLEAPA